MSFSDNGFGPAGYNRNEDFGFKGTQFGLKNSNTSPSMAASYSSGVLSGIFQQSSKMTASPQAGPSIDVVSKVSDQKFQAPNIQAAAIQNTANPDQARQSIGVTANQVSHVQGKMEETMNTAKKMVTNEIGDVAKQKGFDARSAVISAGAAHAPSTLADAVVSTATNKTIDLAGAILDMAGDRKRLKPGEIQNVVAEAHTRLASRQQQKGLVSSAESVVSTKPQVQFDKTNNADINAVLDGSWKQQKPAQDLKKAEENLDHAETVQDDAEAKRKEARPTLKEEANEKFKLESSAEVTALTSLNVQGELKTPYYVFDSSAAEMLRKYAAPTTNLEPNLATLGMDNEAAFRPKPPPTGA